MTQPYDAPWQPPTTNMASPAILPAAATQRQALPFQFTGTGSEYFRIWIVNTLLTIVTLGVYSAWAKVRKRQYFYRNTRVAGSSFDYLADPIKILKGRVIVVAFLGTLVWFQYYSPALYLAMALVLFFATPWVVVKSLAFNARNSSYRGIRLAFPGRVGEAYGVYITTTLLYLATCGVGYPWMQWKLTQFVLKRHYWGDCQFDWNTPSPSYFKAYLIALALAVPGYVCMFIAIFAMSQSSAGAAPTMMLIPAALFFVYLLVPGSYLRAKLANLTYNGLTVHHHAFSSNQQPVELFKLYLTNTLAILFSLGLATPWAQIRLAAYRASALTLFASGGVYAQSLLSDDTSAIGEGMSDFGDFDLGIGV